LVPSSPGAVEVRARLARAGTRVTLIDADAATVDALNREGVSLTEDTNISRIAVSAALAASATGPFDAALLFTKTYHAAAAAASVRHLLAPGACILSLQNGLGNGERIRSAVPEAYVAIGSTTWPADATGRASVRTHGFGDVRLWSLDGSPHRILHDLDALLRQAGLRSQLDPQVGIVIWEKVIFNCAMNPVAALSGATVGEIAGCEDGRALAQAILEEGFEVARAAGVNLDEDRVRSTVAKAYREHAAHRPSMAHDVAHSRRSEIDAINGAVLEIARTRGIATPVNETLVRLMRIVDSRHP
jgi:2-dehydropantoate 2-reductase